MRLIRVALRAPGRWAMLGRPTKEAVVIQELLGRRDVNTTMIYTHVLEPGAGRGSEPG